MTAASASAASWVAVIVERRARQSCGGEAYFFSFWFPTHKPRLVHKTLLSHLFSTFLLSSSDDQLPFDSHMILHPLSTSCIPLGCAGLVRSGKDARQDHRQPLLP